MQQGRWRCHSVERESTQFVRHRGSREPPRYSKDDGDKPNTTNKPHKNCSCTEWNIASNCQPVRQGRKSEARMRTPVWHEHLREYSNPVPAKQAWLTKSEQIDKSLQASKTRTDKMAARARQRAAAEKLYLENLARRKSRAHQGHIS